MIRSFKNKGTEDIYNGINSKNARSTCPKFLWENAIQRLDKLNFATEIEDMRIPAGNRLKKLKGSREDQYSIRINSQYRICFRWTSDGPYEVEITDYH